MGARAVPNVEAPGAGERFSDEELHSRYGVPMHGGIRISEENRCIILVDRAGSRPVQASAGRGTYILDTGQNSDGGGGQGQGMHESSLALSRSKEEGYTVLYFTKEGGALVFNSRVEYDSHESYVETDGGGQKREVARFRLRAVAEAAPGRRRPAGDEPRVAIEAAPEGAARKNAEPDAVAMIERAICMQSAFRSKAHLIRALPGNVDMVTLDRVLEILLRSARIAIDGDAIRWAAGAEYAAGQVDRSGGGGATEARPSFAGTFLEGIGDDRAPGETVGEYIVRLVNADEPGAFDGEDAKEIDEDLCQMAKGECYTFEQIRKELGLWHTGRFLEGMRAGASGMPTPKFEGV